MEDDFEKRFPSNAKDYKLYEEVGEGVSATVYRALCIPLNQIVAIKVLDLEKCNNDLDGIRREVQTMSLIDHPNVLRSHCSFTSDHCLWLVMPFMSGGSCLHIMKSAYPEGFEESVIATLLCEVLRALIYLHGHGHIHRDVKAGNILVDANGAVKLADFGVSACMFDTGDRQRSRNTFVGTPCWMAPEVMQQLHGYDFKADIWSFGITALELSHGHAPFSKYPPMKVLLMTLQNAPPGLDYERDKKFSKSFKDMVAACLVKDPKKRPSSEKLLKHPFFKHARSYEYLTRTILDGLPPLGDRFRILKGKESSFLLQNKAITGDKEQLSKQEYIRGISAWNFNLEDLKAQASLIDSSEDAFNSGYLDNNHEFMLGEDGEEFTAHTLSSERIDQASTANSREQDLQDLEGAFASVFPSRPLEALKTCFDVYEDDTNATSPDSKDSRQSNSESIFRIQQETKICDGENMETIASVSKNIYALGRQKFSSGSLVPEHVLSPYKLIVADAGSRYQHERNHSGPLLHRQMRDSNSLASVTHAESEGRVIHHKGRFKVISADIGPKVAPSTNCFVNSVIRTPAIPVANATSFLPTLQFLLQQNAMQKEQLLKLTKFVEPTLGHQEELSDVGNGDLTQHSQALSRVRELHDYMVHLQQSVGKLSEEVQSFKLKNAQLEQQVNTLTNKDKEISKGEEQTLG